MNHLKSLTMDLRNFRKPNSIPEDLMDTILEDFKKSAPMTIHEYNDLRGKYVEELTPTQLADLDCSGLVKCAIMKPERLKITPKMGIDTEIEDQE